MVLISSAIVLTCSWGGKTILYIKIWLLFAFLSCNIVFIMLLQSYNISYWSLPSQKCLVYPLLDHFFPLVHLKSTQVTCTFRNCHQMYFYLVHELKISQRLLQHFPSLLPTCLQQYWKDPFYFLVNREKWMRVVYKSFNSFINLRHSHQHNTSTKWEMQVFGDPLCLWNWIQG